MISIMGKPVPPTVEGLDLESMNLVPPTDGLCVKQAEIVPGMINTWYEFVPPCYDGTKPFPLVIHLHGGGNDGMRWSEKTIWHEIARREGLILVYPNSPVYGAWGCEEQDIQYLYDLIQRLCAAYCIDRSRIYMQGMSNGDMMTLAFTMRHPGILAAAGYCTGPSADEAIAGDRPAGALPIIQMRGECDVAWRLTPETEDVYATRYGMNDRNREIWETVNGTEGVLPLLQIRGKDNFLYYPGKAAPIINWEIKSMGHREPVNGAQVFWDVLYSGAKLDNGCHTVSGIRTPITADQGTVILSMGSRYVYRGDGRILMSDQEKATCRVFLPVERPRFCPVKLDEMCETEFMAAPVEFFRAVYGAQIEFSATGEGASLRFPDGRVVRLLSRSILMEVDGSFRVLQKPCVLLSGVLYVPVGEICEILFDSHVSIADDVMCISDHVAELGKYTASILRRILGGVMRPRKRPANW